ncbi:MAG: hypothetical protein R3F53_15305 [Gammaproteobacteria bacterium]
MTEVHRIFRWLFLKCLLARVINNRFLQIIVPSMAGFYFLILDVWGDGWRIVKDYLPFHEKAFIALMVIALISQVFKGMASVFMFNMDNAYISFLEKFMYLTAAVVDLKLKRFRDCATKLKPSGNTFRAITDPKTQIDFIISQSLMWLRESFALTEDEFSMTVIRIDGKNGRCYYAFDSHPSWKRTKARDIISGKSAASYCLEKGEPIFFADKFSAAKEHQYHLSDRDSRAKAGSVYCYPVFVKVSDYEDRYIISAVTYKKRLCSSADEDAAKIVQAILREICRRVELELTLLSIRSWQFSE